MGGFMSLFSRWFGSKERRILILGLDGAGKNIVLPKRKWHLNYTKLFGIDF